MTKQIDLEIAPPKLTNNPSLDVIATRQDPLLSFLNAEGGPKKRHYEIQLDISKDFNSENLIEYKEVPENGEFVSDKKVETNNLLKDKTRYFWRVRTVTDHGKSDWAVSRFFVDCESDDHFMNMTRAKVKDIEASAGYNVKNIIDYDDPGLVSFWQSPPPGEKTQWIKFDLGKPIKICRVWILSNPTDADGWLKDFYLEKSNDAENWEKIPETEIKNNNTFRNIIDFPETEAQYFRLVISDFIGYAIQINEMILYSLEKPAALEIPDGDYILIVGNEHNGFTFTDLAKHVESLGFNLKTVTVPYYEASLEMLNNLSRKPKAIICSGNNADYPNLPMFEHNGEFEIMRKTNIPLLGICAGHQFLAMTYGYTRARSMGWSDITAIEPKTKWARIKILKQDPIFAGIPDNFTAPEVHSWAVVEPAEEFEVLAKSTYIQVQKSKKRLIYGIQFHAEINVDYNQGRKFIENFLKIVLEK